MPNPSTLTFRLLSRSFPQLHDEPGTVEVGLQDKAQQVHAGVLQADGVWCHEGTLTVKPDKATGEPDFSGPFVHGGRGGRFLYISWKRVPAIPTPWVQRIKIPLAGLTWALIDTSRLLSADISGRRPHSSEPIVWQGSA